MFDRLLNSISGDYNQKKINKLLPFVKQINDLDAQWDDLTDEQIKAKTPEFIARIENGATLDDIMPEAFATVKQATKRMRWMKCVVKWQEIIWDMVPYDVQLLGWIILHNGIIAEMKTGEWKTLVATLPVYLNALAKKWVHVVTVNDYLASRDSEWMAYLYNWLWLSTGSITKSTPLHTRRQEYEKDITYVENTELGFDYLRDNLVKSNAERQLLWRPLHYAIVDEVDSILIDEARTPLIISYPSEEPTEKYTYYSTIVRQLRPCAGKKKVSKWLIGDMLNPDAKEEEDGDYYIDEKQKNVSLSSMGIAKLEQIIGVENIYNDLWYDEIHHIENALRASAVYVNNKDYIVQDGEILIVAQHTGRTMPWRRYSEGLHQAIEAKEWVLIQRESKTMATITYQNFFKIYKKLAGMTGTATTEGEEFEKIYSLEVLSVPTNRPTIRVDKNDKVFFNQNAKWNAVVDHIRFYHEAGVPMLIGTSAISTSEYVSDLLRKLGIQHYVLNAKFHQQEAEIIANAGKFKSVVVATNMAWRGTDIKLEKWLFQKTALGYATIAKHTLEGDTFAKIPPKWVSFTVYSSAEYEFTIGGLQALSDGGLSDEAIRQATGQRYEWTNYRLKIILRTQSKKKNDNGANAGDAFAQILMTPKDNIEPEIIQRDLHYGLLILGTEKHESRRIDNQLRGRAWRQWDPGLSVFFVGLDDEIMRKMGGEKIQSVAKMLLPQDQLEQLELTQSQFTNSIVRAQKQMEWWNFSIRKHLFDYDSVVNTQRQRVYAKRDEILAQELWDATQVQDAMTPTMREIDHFIPKVIDSLLAQYSSLELDKEQIIENLQQEFAIANFATLVENAPETIEELEHTNAGKKSKRQSAFRNKIINALHSYYKTKVTGSNIQSVDATMRMIYLNIMDKYWVDHIDAMENLRDKVGLYGYAQQDPLVMYKQEAYTKYEQLVGTIEKEILAIALRTEFNQMWQPQQVLAQQEAQDEFLLRKLEEAAQSAPSFDPRVMMQPWFDATASVSPYAKAFAENNDSDVEVIELSPSNSTDKGSELTIKTHSNSGFQVTGVNATVAWMPKQYWRNDIVILVSPQWEQKEMKYKKIDEYLAKGWIIKG